MGPIPHISRAAARTARWRISPGPMPRSSSVGFNQRESSIKYRLTTEAEWEICLPGGNHDPLFTGNCMHNQPGQLHGNTNWFNCRTACYRQKTIKVELSGNPWGLYDMHGNVWEVVSGLVRELSS